MSGWETLNCENHPDRIALERCEVCSKPLCAYCLYYTEDGQRLCAEHAEWARQAGATIEEPAAYADQLIGAQVGMIRKGKRGQIASDEDLYKGNSTDLVSLIGLLIGVISLAACCGGAYCLPLVGLVLSLVALVNAGNAHDPKRTRRLGVIGLLVSGVWVLIIAGCIIAYGLSMRSFWTGIQSSAFQGPIWWPTDTPTPSPSHTATATPGEDVSNASAFVIETPAP